MSRYYEKYFEGYEEERVPNKNGKGTHIEYTYVDLYYRLNLPTMSAIAIRGLYLILFAGALALFVYSVLLNENLNMQPYMVIGQGLCLLAAIWMVWVLGYYVTAPRNMTAYKYKSTSTQLMKAARLLGVLMGAEAVMLLLGCLMTKGIDIQDSVPAIWNMIIGAVFMIAVYLIERNLTYSRVSGKEEHSGWIQEGGSYGKQNVSRCRERRNITKRRLSGN